MHTNCHLKLTPAPVFQDFNRKTRTRIEQDHESYICLRCRGTKAWSEMPTQLQSILRS